MKVVIVYDETEIDPTDPEHSERIRRSDFIDDNIDCVVIRRVWGDQYDRGYREVVVGQGIWANITDDQWNALLDQLEPSL